METGYLLSCVNSFRFFALKVLQLCVFFGARLEKMGALDVSMVVHKHQVWRLFTCIWLHAGVFHVLANMLSLIFIGIRLEQEFGFGMHLKFSLFIFLQFQFWLFLAHNGSLELL